MYFMGVSVGSVSSMELITGNPVKVRVDIKVLASTPVDSGTYASLVAQGITGVNVINIAAVPGEHSPLPPTKGSQLPTIPVRETGLSAMLAQAPVTVAKLNEVLDQINLLLGSDNRQSIAASLQHIESLVEAVAADRQTWSELPTDLKQMVGNANRLVNDLNQVVTGLQPDLSATLAHTRQTAANAEQITARLDQLLSDNQSELEHFIDNGLGQAPDMIFELRSSLRDLQKLLRQLQEDPSQLIHRPPNDALEVNP